MGKSLGQIGWLLNWVMILLATNRWLPWNDGINLLSANDALAYNQIAEAAPALSTTLLNFHHAQRLIAPYLVGLLADVTQLPLPICFRLVAYGCLGVMLLSMHRLLSGLRLTRLDYALGMGLLVLNPYVLRYYLIVPGLLPDVVFIMGTALVLCGLVSVRGAIVLLGIVLAAIGRQTALFLVPGLLVWLMMGNGWRGRSLRWKGGMIGAIVLLPIVIYGLTAQMARRFALASVNTTTVTGLFTWLSSPQFTWSMLGEHCLRLVIPVITVMGLLITVTLQYQSTQPIQTLDPSSSQGKKATCVVEQGACLLMTVGVIAQPFLAGPDITGQNATRLAALGFLPLLTAFVLGLQHRPLLTATRPLARTILLSSVVLGSFHHLYTAVALPNAISFVILQLGITVVMTIVIVMQANPLR